MGLYTESVINEILQRYFRKLHISKEVVPYINKLSNGFINNLKKAGFPNTSPEQAVTKVLGSESDLLKYALSEGKKAIAVYNKQSQGDKNDIDLKVLQIMFPTTNMNDIAYIGGIVDYLNAELLESVGRWITDKSHVDIVDFYVVFNGDAALKHAFNIKDSEIYDSNNNNIIIKNDNGIKYVKLPKEKTLSPKSPIGFVKANVSPIKPKKKTTVKKTTTKKTKTVTKSTKAKKQTKPKNTGNNNTKKSTKNSKEQKVVKKKKSNKKNCNC